VIANKLLVAHFNHFPILTTDVRHLETASKVLRRPRDKALISRADFPPVHVRD
jgi:hypothetical protein